MPNCFVIMPFGEKVDPSGKSIDFDEIYDCVIKPGAESVKGMKCIRCDKIAEAGVVHKQMLEQIYQADAAVVDITTSNPNVFYELGVRHSLAERVTVIIKRKGANIPFNIQSMKAIEYDPESPRSVTETKQKIMEYIKNGLQSRAADSLVYNSLPISIAKQPTPIPETKVYRYKLSTDDREIRLITGDLQDVTCVDAWVSSENTNMEMSRYYERSISGVIRYLGAKKKAGQVVDDTVAKLLRAVVGENLAVQAGTVIVTGAGELEKTHNVKRIFHAAAVFGQVGKGFRPIPDVSKCVSNAFAEASSPDLKDAGIQSILFPLMGTGHGGANPQEAAHLLISKAVACLKATQTGPLKQVYFLCWTEEDLEHCRGSLKQIGLKEIN